MPLWLWFIFSPCVPPISGLNAGTVFPHLQCLAQCLTPKGKCFLMITYRPHLASWGPRLSFLSTSEERASGIQRPEPAFSKSCQASFLNALEVQLCPCSWILGIQEQGEGSVQQGACREPLRLEFNNVLLPDSLHKMLTPPLLSVFGEFDVNISLV